MRAERPATGCRDSRMSSARISTRSGLPAGRSRNPTISSGPSSRRSRLAFCSGAWSSRRAEKTLSTPSNGIDAVVRPPRRGQDVQRRAFGDDLPPLQQEQPRAQRDGLGDAVRDVEHRDRQRTLDLAEPADHRVAVGQVERRDRLVAEQEPGPGCQRPRQADPLPLAAREVSPATDPSADRRRRARRPRPAGRRPRRAATPSGRSGCWPRRSGAGTAGRPGRSCRSGVRAAGDRSFAASRRAPRPSRRTWPESGRVSPAISRSTVVLPAPDGPNTTPISRPSRNVDVERSSRDGPGGTSLTSRMPEDGSLTARASAPAWCAGRPGAPRSRRPRSGA